MKKAVIFSIVLVMTSPAWAQTLSPKDSSAPPSATPAPAATPADAAWEKIKSDFQDLQAISLQVLQKDPSKMIALLKEAHDFPTQFPNDPRVVDAGMVWAQLGDVMNQRQISGGPTDAQISQFFDQLGASEKLSKDKRAEVRAMQISRALQFAAEAQTDDPAQWKAIEDKMTAFQKDFGADFALGEDGPVMVELRSQELQALAARPDHAHFQAELETLKNDPQPEVAKMAHEVDARLKKMAELKTKPLDIKFTSVDGKEVDLAKLRGKVVLVDYWATWCPPCLVEMPQVIAAYKKYHDKGFDIVGISLDEDKAALLDFVKQNGIAWPQYFDGLRLNNKISSSFGIDGIPTMWLVDKKGMLISTDAAEDLDGQIQKALATP